MTQARTQAAIGSPLYAAITTGAKYVALTTTAQEVLWLTSIVKEMQLDASTPIIHGDNTSSHFLAKNPAHHKRTKHIDVRYHWIREQLTNKLFKLSYINSKDNLADMLTKFMSTTNFVNCSSRVMSNRLRESIDVRARESNNNDDVRVRESVENTI